MSSNVTPLVEDVIRPAGMFDPELTYYADGTHVVVHGAAPLNSTVCNGRTGVTQGRTVESLPYPFQVVRWDDDGTTDNVAPHVLARVVGGEPVSTAEAERATEWLRALHEAGYADLDVLHTPQGPVRPGTRVRIASGDGTVLHLVEREGSPWATSWGSRDIEIILRMDSGRTAQVAQYHLHWVYESGG